MDFFSGLDMIFPLIILTILLICPTNQGQNVTEDGFWCPALNLTWDLEQMSELKDFYAPNEEVRLQCKNRSKVLVGSNILRCSAVIEAPNMWDSGLPICVEIPCAIPIPPEGGKVIFIEPEIVDYFISVMYSCNHGFQLIGQSVQSCTEAGFWTATPPRCFVDCSQPLAPPDGGVEADCFYENCTASFYCNKGYELSVVSANYSTCSPTGRWVPVTPVCEAIQCPHPGMIENGSMMHYNVPHVQNTFRFKTTVYYTCNDNFTLVGTKNLTCNAHGLWSGEKPECIYTVPATTPLPDNITTDNSTTGSTTLNATHHHLTTTRAPHHHFVSCGSLPVVTFASYRRYGRVVRYRCIHGYRIQGEDEVTCMNGTWVGHIPECIPITQHNPETTTKMFLWEQIFINNEHWEGGYEFHRKRHTFVFKRLSVQLDISGSVIGLFMDNNAKFELKGSQDDTGAIVFTRMKEHVRIKTDRFISTYWYVEGKLERRPCIWYYSGTIHSSKPGFGTFSMSSPILNRYNNQPECGTSTNTTVIIIGVISAFCVLLIIAVGVIFWAKRSGKLQTGPHRTLTSFENPVYEYEQNINSSSSNPIDLKVEPIMEK